jgi:predicted transcriptional regulator
VNNLEQQLNKITNKFDQTKQEIEKLQKEQIEILGELNKLIEVLCKE